ncbi:putative GntR family transcriptional regulator [Microlunatus phosphovorus NM-1]|uniref:Putative GntR family transcriptional regulator n=1 Tax=Microlunatus phosphovorus (strain ATCC 700054 / DSM 10555 / JCM 9379 / NBRC 101784 / NCIMB 13414 / VKM Ac-1990 / NM-1) TaxID=1032480 RepID=F5XL34_MICPN|nr:GntR family transcriptional regulator [Microlunatus phosphovorus]BAK33722.1 putative GntR family transcriptional regulator [Microlunatus phosphovorus NM-1]
MAQLIERTSPVPYYEQLFGILKDRIVGGEFPVGERLPSELELGREFGLARATVRQTLSKLESEGYARRVARRGVFAATPDASQGWLVQDTEGFLESQIRHGRTGIETTVIEAGYLVPPQHTAEALGLQPDEQAFALKRARSLDGKPALFSTNWLPRESGAVVAAAPDVLNGTGSLNSTLRNAGFVINGARRVIHAMRAPKEVARHLGVGPGAPVLRIRSLSWDQQDRYFDYYETWVLTGTVPLELNIVAT